MVKEVIIGNGVRITESDDMGIFIHYKSISGKVFGVSLGSTKDTPGHTWAKELLDKYYPPIANQIDHVVMRDAIKLFFNEMVAECSGSDNGIDAVLNDYVTDKALRPFMECYISKI